MQLSDRPRGSVRGRLAAAACVLVGAAATPVDAMEVSSATLVYSEPDRVTALETQGSLRANFGGGRTLTIRGVFDSLTGASPNGATPSRFTQTFTRSSGGESYTVAPGETPTDESFQDTRYAGSASLAWPLNRLTRFVAGSSYSTEFDYESFSVDGRIVRDFFQRNTTVAVSVARAFDTIDPDGGAPIPLSTMRREGLPQPKTDTSREKRITDVVLGLTQVIDAATLIQMNYSFHRSSGYLTDPYKLVSVVQAEDAASPGTPFEYVYESRPDSRTKHALYWEGKRARGWDVANLSYRYLWDDWGVRSHTAEARYRWEITRSHGLEPQVRFYRQTAPDFFAHSVIDGAPRPLHVSADFRLADMDAWTTAMRYTYRFPQGYRLAARFGYYRQTGDSHPDDAIGALRDQDLFPTLGAIISQVSFTIGG